MKLSGYYLYVLLAGLLIMSGCASTQKPALNDGRSAYSPSADPSSRSAGTEASGSAAMAEKRNSKRNKKSNYKTSADLVKEYEERMEANAKRYKKEAKLSEKPQYSDPSYFGHKKKPKKRPVGKRKFCKECQIVH